MILTTDEVITFILKVISTTTKVIFATEQVIRTTLKVISATTKVILTTEKVITAILKVISATTQVILCSIFLAPDKNSRSPISDMHIQNKKYRNFFSISRLTGKCAAQKL